MNECVKVVSSVSLCCTVTKANKKKKIINSTKLNTKQPLKLDKN